jgi:N-6 DNA Methylase
MAIDFETLAHREWLGMLQPVGLVVSPPALVKGQAIINRGQTVDLQQQLQSLVSESLADDEAVAIADFTDFATKVLAWMPEDLVSDLPSELEVVLPDYGETLRPNYAVPDPDSGEWMLLVKTVAIGLDLDEVEPAVGKNQGWKATIQAKFERLLRETQVPIGVLWNGTHLRLVYAPRGESSGHLTFPIQAMTEVGGRPILGALEMLLGSDRLFTLPSDRRLPKLLSESREYQVEVSTKLAEQVLDALWELLRGLQSADAAAKGALVSELVQTNPQHVYGGLLTTLMRLVFLLYAEDEGLMPNDEVYQRNYSVSGLYERLREDAGSYPDTMDQRYGAWAGLLSLFRLVYDGGGATPEYLPARHGQLFDPDEYAFLEGRSLGSCYQEGDIAVPRIPDGVIYRMLDKLLILDGERLSYRSLEVEQIGSIYEAAMGFEVKIACNVSIAIRPRDVVVNVEEILAANPSDRVNLLKGEGCQLVGKAQTAIKSARTVEEFVTALDRKISSRTPNLLTVGSFYLQPTAERRQTGTHYTPSSLIESIVRTTLEPVLEQLGERPTAAQILALKICDPAMGTGAFLVEACRQLSDQVLAAWEREKAIGGIGWSDSEIPLVLEEEPLLYARRLVAQQCLYGVDKNPFAVKLAKLSLWLMTLAKDLPFTFLDSSLGCGDSLVGAEREEVKRFRADAVYAPELNFDANEDQQRADQQVHEILDVRQKIRASDTHTDEEEALKLKYLQDLENLLFSSRMAADLLIAAFFEGTTKKQREDKLQEYAEKLLIYEIECLDLNAAAETLTGDLIISAQLAGKTQKQRRRKLQEHSGQELAFERGLVSEQAVFGISERLRTGERAVRPFHWSIEHPEVLSEREPADRGYDAIVGNPPFAGKNTIIAGHAENYLTVLKERYPESHGNSDLVAYFFRRAFELLKPGGAFGLIATNTIAQGDTRNTGLRWICTHGGTIYNAQKRVKWTGKAAVVVSVIHATKGAYKSVKWLDGKVVSQISAFLFHSGGHENPATLIANANKSFIGSYVLGMGFTFDDTNPDATPIAQMHELIAKDSHNTERIFPYIGGEEVNSSPTHAHHRYVINFGEMSETEAREYPDLMAIVEEKVKPERDKLGNNADALRRKTKWWLWGRYTPALFRAIAHCDRVLVVARVGQHGSFTFLPSGMVYSEQLVVFALPNYSTFCTLQSRIHEIWARFFGSSMKDDLRYTPSDCFETFPFPPNWETDETLEAIGKTYYEFRAELMIRHNEGLTQTYNRFHDPDETNADILKLRQLHAECDRAVLDAYGWDDVAIECEFFLDYEEEETENSKRKKPWRYRWNEATHDEVLARLLSLNQERYDDEIKGGKLANKKSNSKKNTPRKPKFPTTDQQLMLMPEAIEQLDLAGIMETSELNHEQR